MNTQEVKRIGWILLVVALATSGCGGGGGGDDTSKPPSTVQTDSTAPETTITSKPAALANSSTANFSATATEAGSSFEASLDSAPFAAVTPPLQLSSLADGNHTISIRARDAAGNVDASPATFTWTIDTGAPTAKILFPLPNSYTDASALTVRGVAADANGVASVHVNDVAATSSDGFATWTASIPIQHGQNQIVVSITDGAGNTNANAANASVLNRGPVVGWSAGVAYDASSNQILIGDRSNASLSLFNATTGLGKPLATHNQTSLGSVAAVAMDEAHHRALVIDQTREALVGVDLSDGSTHDIATADAVNAIGDGASITVDPSQSKAYVGTLDSVVEVNLDSGVLRTVSAGGIVPPFYTVVGTGPTFIRPALAWDSYTNPSVPRLVGAVVMSGSPSTGAITSIDIATGDRHIIAPTDANSAPLTNPTSVAIDPANHHLLVLDSGTQTLLSVDLATGDRTVVSSQSDAAGAQFVPTIGLAVAGNKAFIEQQPSEVLSVDLSTGTQHTVVQSKVGEGSLFGAVDTAVIEQPGQAPQSLLILEGGRLTRVSLSTGDHTVISSASAGSGPFTTGFTSMVLDTRVTTTKPSALAILAETSEVVSIDLATGNRTHAADLGLAGVNYIQRFMRLDPETNRIYFINLDLSASNRALCSYDFGTGQRATVANHTVGSGPTIYSPTSILLDKNSNRVLVSDVSRGGFISVDLATGARTLFANDPGAIFQSGPLYSDAAQSRFIGVKSALDMTAPLAQSALAALHNGNWEVNDASLFTMMAMIQNTASFTDSDGTAWTGGAANYNGSKAQSIAFATQYNLSQYYSLQQLFSLGMPDGTGSQLISGPDPIHSAVRGSGPQQRWSYGMDVDPLAGIAYLAQSDTYAVMAIDLVSGDRILISH